MHRIQFEPVGQHFADYGSGRHRQRAADDDAGPPVGAGKHRQHGGRTQRQRDLRRAKTEHDAAHGHQFRQTEFETDAEHQKHHAEFGQIARAFVVGDQGEAVWPDQHADQQIAEHRRHLQHAKQNNHQHRGSEKYENGVQRIVHGALWRNSDPIMPYRA